VVCKGVLESRIDYCVSQKSWTPSPNASTSQYIANEGGAQGQNTRSRAVTDDLCPPPSLWAGACDACPSLLLAAILRWRQDGYRIANRDDTRLEDLDEYALPRHDAVARQTVDGALVVADLADLGDLGEGGAEA
jgi:hypothetical protein